MNLFPQRIHFRNGFGWPVTEAILFKGKIIAFSDGKGYAKVDGYPVVYHRRCHNPHVVGEVLLAMTPDLAWSDDGITFNVLSFGDRVIKLGVERNVAYIALPDGQILTSKDGKEWTSLTVFPDITKRTPYDVRVWKSLVICLSVPCTIWEDVRTGKTDQFFYHRCQALVHHDEMYLATRLYLHHWKGDRWEVLYHSDSVINGIYSCDHGIIIINQALTHIFDPVSRRNVMVSNLFRGRCYVTLINGDTYDVATEQRVLCRRKWAIDCRSPFRRKASRNVLLSFRRFNCHFVLFYQVMEIV